MKVANEKGLAGVTVGETAIATVGKSGKGLTYRGYAIEDLASHASFEEVAYLLIYGSLPTKSELEHYQQCLQSLREIPNTLKTTLQLMPGDAHPMDVLRTACSMLGVLEPETEQHDQYHIADRLMAIFPSILTYWYHFHKGTKIKSDYGESCIAGNFLHSLQQKPVDDLSKQFMNVSLILYAEHEFNASTFTARVITATLSDVYSAITGAIGALKGPLHGGANEAVFRSLQQFSSVKQAQLAIQHMIKDKQKIMGFGHRVYTESDPRSDILKYWVGRLSKANNDDTIFPIYQAIETLMWEQKKLFANADFYSAAGYYFCNIPVDMFTPIFVMARIVGWMAHIIEQRANNRLIRPSANYIGAEPREYIPIMER